MGLLQVTYAVCSGSEANDLALRIARAVSTARLSVVLGLHSPVQASVLLPHIVVPCASSAISSHFYRMLECSKC